MIRILFASSTHNTSEIETRYRPLWAGYLAAYLEKHIGADQFEFKYISHPLEEEIQSYKPDILALSSVTQNYSLAKADAKIAKSLGVPVVIGGMHITAIPHNITEDMDVGCIGEGEETFLELMRHFMEYGEFRKDKLESIQSIVYYYDGKLIQTPRRPAIDPLDSLPHPKRSITGYSNREYVYTARGCPYKCSFCAIALFWGKPRYSSPEYIIEEIHELIDHGVTTIRFNDDNFIANRKRLRAIADLMAKNGLNKRAKYSCWIRANDVNPEIVKCLKDMNVVACVMGIESGNDRLLKFLKGGVSVTDNFQAINMLKDAGIQTSGDFVIGSPDETEEEILDTYNLIKKSRLDFININVCSPLPGTLIWNDAMERGLISEDMDDWNRINFKFNKDPEKAIILSKKLTHSQLARIHRKFQILRIMRFAKAIPRSPWFEELPGIVKKRVVEFFHRTGPKKEKYI